MPSRAKKTWTLLKTVFREFLRDDPFSMAGAIAYTTVFSMPALIMITVWVASIVYDQDAVRTALFDQLASLIGRSSSDSAREVVEKMRVGEARFYAKVLGLGTLIFSATAVFVTLQNSINKIWRVRAKPRRGLVRFILARLLSLTMIAGIGFLLLVSLVIDAGLAAVTTYLNGLFADQALMLMAVLNLAISLAVVTGIFILVFKYLPDAHVPWKDVRLGSLVTAVLFVLGKSLIGYYIGSSKLDDAYGAAGSIVVILIWVYYSAVIVLFGAEFTYVYTRDRGRGIKPVSHAVEVKIREVEHVPPKDAQK